MSSKTEWLAVYNKCVDNGIEASVIMAYIEELLAKRNAN